MFDKHQYGTVGLRTLRGARAHLQRTLVLWDDMSDAAQERDGATFDAMFLLGDALRRAAGPTQPILRATGRPAAAWPDDDDGCPF